MNRLGKINGHSIEVRKNHTLSARVFLVSALIVSIFACTMLPGCYTPDSWLQFNSGAYYRCRPPSVSPDGSTVLFSSPATGHGDIYSYSLKEKTLKKLTSDPGFETNPTFSPDGETIFFEREQTSPTFACHIWTMSKDGQNQRQLTSGEQVHQIGSFANDGQTLQIVRVTDEGGLGLIAKDLYVDQATGQFQEMPFEGNVFWLRKKQAHLGTIYLSEADKEGAVSLLNNDGSTKRLCSGYAWDVSPAEDEFLCRRESTKSLLIMSMQGDEIAKLGDIDEGVFSGEQSDVFYTKEFGAEFWKYDRATQKHEQIKSPEGRLQRLARCPGGIIVQIIMDDKPNDRVGSIYRFDCQQSKFERVIDISSLK